MIEAVEQTERLDLPEIEEFMDLQTVLDNWPEDRMLIVCDESKSEPKQARAMAELNSAKVGKAAILIGPEGGFSSKEREQLNLHSCTEHISLGPRILRSDTAAIAALSIYQSNFGDWYNEKKN
jgi:16S rRNA (uracil1498-N3)-methyltransferase